MKKKNGFTIVELLATIAIMGVLMMIAVPTMSIYINSSKVDSFVYTIRQYEKAVEDMYLTDRLVCSNGTSTNVSPFDVDSGTFQVVVDTRSGSNYCASGICDYAYSNYTKLLKDGGKSPFNNNDVFGYIYFVKSIDDTTDVETIDWFVSIKDTKRNGITGSYNIKSLKASNINKGSSDTVQRLGFGSSYTCKVN